MLGPCFAGALAELAVQQERARQVRQRTVKILKLKGGPADVAVRVRLRGKVAEARGGGECHLLGGGDVGPVPAPV